MAAIGHIAGAIGKVLPLGAIGLVGNLLNKPKPKAVAQPVPLPTINSADAMAAQRQDALRKRRGAGANELTGGGAEAVTPGGKALLGM